MIKTLEVKNFKSIKHLKLDCKRVNVFIGKPNTGKSNMLESVGIFSLPFVHENLKDLVRFENMANLFHDQEVSENIEITADTFLFTLKFENGKFKLSGKDEARNLGFDFDLAHEGKGSMGRFPASPFKFYKFAAMPRFPRWEADFLLPPKGENLLQMLLTNKELRKVIAGLFSEYGLKVVLKPQEHEIEVQREARQDMKENIVIFYPYPLISDTLQRIVFHLLAIETNKDSVIIFEEPEAHAFPYYTKFLAERIALANPTSILSRRTILISLSPFWKKPQRRILAFLSHIGRIIKRRPRLFLKMNCLKFSILMPVYSLISTNFWGNHDLSGMQS